MIYFLWIIVILLIVVFFYIGIPSVFKIIFRNRFLSTLIKDDCIYITFDDGPNPDSTPEILRILNKYKAKATFFVTGKNIEKYPELINDIIRMGHIIGDHGYNHLHAWKTDPYSSLSDFLKFENSLKKIKKFLKAPLYRPPYGKLNLVILLYNLIKKKEYIFWDIDPKDYKNPSPDTVAEFVTNRLKPGSVILLHDGRNKIDNTSCKVTISALDLILQASHEKGLKFSLFDNVV